MKARRFIASLTLILLVASAALAQIASPPDDETRAATEKKALALLEQTATDADSLKLPENRIYVFASVGDLLWARDEKRARRLFRQAATEMNAAFNQAEESHYGLPDNFWLIQNVRNSLIQQVANRDAELALELLRQTRLPVFNQVLDLPEEKISLYRQLYSNARAELETEQQLAARILKQNPRRALELARANLKRGATYSHLSLIEELEKTDLETASKFADEVLQKLLSTDFIEPENGNTRNLASSFISKFSLRVHPAGNDPENQTRRVRINQDAIDRLAQKYADYFFSDGFQPNNFYEIQSTLPMFEKVLPERVPRLRQKFETLKQNYVTSNSYNQFQEKLNQLSSTAAPDALLAEAENFPVEMRSQIYSLASSKMAQAGNFEGARALLASLPRGQNRNQMLFNLDWQAFNNYWSQEKYSEAEQIVSLQTDNSNRIKFLVEIARRLLDKKQDEKARQFLTQAQTLINSVPENSRELTDLMSVLNISALSDPEKAFDLLETFIPKANEIIAAAAFLNKYQPYSSRYREGELIFANYGFGGFRGGEMPIMLDVSSFKFLAKADFERAARLVGKFERNDFRLLARLIILQSVLTDEKTAASLPNNGHHFVSF